MGYLFDDMEKKDQQEERYNPEESAKRVAHLRCELIVFKLSRQGKSNAEIAQLLNMTEEKVQEILGD